MKEEEEIMCGDEQLKHCKELPKLKDLYFSMSSEQQKLVDILEACCEAKQEQDLEQPLDEAVYECGKCTKKESHYATMCKDRKVHKCIEDDDGNWRPPKDCGC